MIGKTIIAIALIITVAYGAEHESVFAYHLKRVKNPHIDKLVLPYEVKLANPKFLEGFSNLIELKYVFGRMPTIANTNVTKLSFNYQNHIAGNQPEVVSE